MNTDQLLELAVDAAATARITRWLVLDDGPPPWGEKRQKLRVWLRARGGNCDDYGRTPCAWCTWANGTECPWCVGVYVAAGVLVARRVAPRAWPVVARWLTAAQIAGLLAVD